MSFSPKSKYNFIPDSIAIKDFFDYQDEYVTRPPYQRKAVWSKNKKQALMDSLIRRYYVPRLVVREVRLSEKEVKKEIIDGQQRITTVQDFFNNDFPLPISLMDIDSGLAGKYYKELDSSYKKFIDKDLKFDADIVKNIESPTNNEHQVIATEIFWRLQQGESLNYMEVAHAKLSSLSRNFIVKYSDDHTFDYKKYLPIDDNKNKLPFFSIINDDNSRMKHLQMMARFILIEQSNGATDLSDAKIEDLINSQEEQYGIDNETFEEKKEAKQVIANLRLFFEIFKNDPAIKKTGDKIKELSVEYFIMSMYMLVRYLRQIYVMDDDTKKATKEFIYYFYQRWKTFDDSTDRDLLIFCNRRQQGEKELEIRDSIVRQIFLEYLREKNYEFTEKDGKRAFSELERVIIYRRSHGKCKQCLDEGKSENEAQVSWSDFQADHIFPHSRGGKTNLENAELLCRMHNQIKGAKLN